MALSPIYYVRADSVTANNSVLNPIGTGGAQGFPVTAIQFTDSGTGDLLLDWNNGGLDPDTRVIIGGTTYTFSVQLIGTLPIGNSSTPDELEGKQVALITVVIDGRTRELFFVLDGSGTPVLMQDFGNGAIPLTLVDLDPPPEYLCFCSGTEIAAPSGRRKIESLVAGDIVLTASGAARQIIWAGATRLGADQLQRNPESRPVVIPAGAFGAGVPDADLVVSPQHRIAIEASICELLFGVEAVLVPARFLVGSVARRADPTDEVVYHHILLEDHDLLFSNGLVSESFQPARRIIEVMSDEMRETLMATLDTLGATEAMVTRPDALPTLSRREAEVLLGSIRVGSGEKTHQPATLHALA
jgi:Hint domain